MGQGEFEKRIRAGYIPCMHIGELTSDVRGLTKIVLDAESVINMIIDAKQEFPMATYGYNLLKIEDCRTLLFERHNWFVKWFGSDKK